MKQIDTGENKSGVAIYQDSSREICLEVRLEKDTVWLGAHKIAAVFGVERPAVVKHINNIYKTGELGKHSTCSILEQAAGDGKIRKMNIF